MLTALQRRIIRLVGDLPEAEGFALAGGAALIAREVVDRPTRDLDFFATETEAVHRLQSALLEAARSDGLDVDVIESYPGFTRLTVSDGRDRCEVDLAYDARIRSPERTPYGLVLQLDELAADKVLALFGRAEARDFIDVAALLPHYGWDRLCRLAVEKDAGFNREVLVDAIRAFRRLPAREFGLEVDAYGELAADARRWEIALTTERDIQGPSLDR